MANIKQYQPDRSGDFSEDATSFDSQSELEAIDYVKEFATLPSGKRNVKFKRYVLHNALDGLRTFNNGYRYIMIAEYKNNMRRFVGFIDDNTDLNYDVYN